MSYVFGIHVGNSTACLAMCKIDGVKYTTEVLANNAGERVMPALVTLTEDEFVVGAACKSLMISRWKSTVTCNKIMLDRDEPIPENGERRVTTVIEDGELGYALPTEDGEMFVTPSEIAERIYHALYDIARSAVPSDVDTISCVLMVPHHYSQEARMRIRNAAIAAGWYVIHILSEPAAAVLSYNLISGPKPPSRQMVLVFRAGGRTCDANILEVDDHGLVTFRANAYLNDVGGKMLVGTLTKYLAEVFYRRYKLNPSETHRSLTKLTLAAENCIHVLSTIKSANCSVESLCEGVDFSHSISRARFESILFEHLSTFSRPIDSVLKTLNMTHDNIHTVLLCGGLMKIPRLKKYISDLFNDSYTTVLSLPNGFNYDEVLACGAAQHAAEISIEVSISHYLPSDMDIAVLEYDIVCQIENSEDGGHQSVVFEAGLPLPSRKEIQLPSNATDVTLIFSQRMEMDNERLSGEVLLGVPENTPNIIVEIDSINGIRISVPNNNGPNVSYPVLMHHVQD